jgi:hypothetical protein
VALIRANALGREDIRKLKLKQKQTLLTFADSLVSNCEILAIADGPIPEFTTLVITVNDRVLDFLFRLPLILFF